MNTMFIVLASLFSLLVPDQHHGGGDPNELEAYSSAQERADEARRRDESDRIRYHTAFCKAGREGFSNLKKLERWGVDIGISKPSLKSAECALDFICSYKEYFYLDRNLKNEKGEFIAAKNEPMMWEDTQNPHGRIWVNPESWDFKAGYKKNLDGDYYQQAVAVHEILSLSPHRIEKTKCYDVSSKIILHVTGLQLQELPSLIQKTQKVGSSSNLAMSIMEENNRTNFSRFANGNPFIIVSDNSSLNEIKGDWLERSRRLNPLRIPRCDPAKPAQYEMSGELNSLHTFNDLPEFFGDIMRSAKEGEIIIFQKQSTSSSYKLPPGIYKIGNEIALVEVYRLRPSKEAGQTDQIVCWAGEAQWKEKEKEDNGS